MATSKTLQPTNVTIQIPAMTDQPDASVFSNCIDKEADAINELNSQLGQVKMQASYGTASTGSVTLPVPLAGRYCILFFAANMVGIVKYDQSQTMYIMGDVPTGWTITDNKDNDRTMTITRSNGSNFSWGLISMVG